MVGDVTGYPTEKEANRILELAREAGYFDMSKWDFNNPPGVEIKAQIKSLIGVYPWHGLYWLYSRAAPILRGMERDLWDHFCHEVIPLVDWLEVDVWASAMAPSQHVQHDRYHSPEYQPRPY